MYVCVSEHVRPRVIVVDRLNRPTRSTLRRLTLSVGSIAIADSGGVPGDIVTISGYLQKKTRDGRWQKRWFETNGCFLTYYKASGFGFVVCVVAAHVRSRELTYDDSMILIAITALTHHDHGPLTTKHDTTRRDATRQSKKMTKLLAALDLVQVGNIKLVETPEPGGR